MEQFSISFESKQANLVGLQIADLAARPIALHLFQPTQPNRAYDVLEPKLWRGPNGEISGWGLEVISPTARDLGR